MVVQYNMNSLIRHFIVISTPHIQKYAIVYAIISYIVFCLTSLLFFKITSDTSSIAMACIGSFWLCILKIFTRFSRHHNLEFKRTYNDTRIK